MKLTKHVSYAGVQEPNKRNYDVILNTNYGTGYNSYLITGDKTAVIDTVPEIFSEEYIDKLKTMLPDGGVDYVILNHAAPDHAGSLSSLLKEFPQAEVYTTVQGMKNAGAISNRKMKVHVVSEGEQLYLGDDIVLEFMIIPDLPWPDTMFTYMEKEQLLFSCDMFSTHFCEPAILDRYMREAAVFREERYRYFQTMFEGRKTSVRGAMKKLKERPIRMICPGHGPILEHHLKETMGYYHSWSMEIPIEDYIAVFFASAHGYTEMMARQLANELRREGIPVKLYDVTKKPIREMEKALNLAGGVMIGTPTIHKDAPKPIWDLISCAKAINLNSKLALVFGSYGWSGEACENVSERLKALKFQVIGEGLTCVLKPSAEDKRRIGEAAREFAAVFFGEQMRKRRG